MLCKLTQIPGVRWSSCLCFLSSKNPNYAPPTCLASWRFFVLFSWFFKAEYLWSLSWNSSADQAGLNSQSFACLCLQSSGIKGVHHHHLAFFFFVGFFFKCILKFYLFNFFNFKVEILSSHSTQGWAVSRYELGFFCRLLIQNFRA